jgi:hypothetical protein
MIEKFGNPDADDLRDVRKSFSRLSAAKPPPAPVVWDTPFDPDAADQVATDGEARARVTNDTSALTVFTRCRLFRLPRRPDDLTT